MRILIGVCGIGFGHVRRQLCLLPKLQEQGHKITVLASNKAGEFMRQRISGVVLVESPVPWIVGSQKGIDFLSSAQMPINRQLIIASQFDALARVIDSFGGRPDLIITDYEPLSAQLAYSSDCPLVTVDQQSKFLGYTFPDLKGFSRIEERSRLGLFFPRAEMRISCSFYCVEQGKDDRYEVELVPAVVRPEVRRVATSKNTSPRSGPVVVYLSSYGPTLQTVAEIVATLGAVKAQSFLLFLANEPHLQPPIPVTSNVRILPFSEDRFVEAVAAAPAAICTAGHTLLSELMLCSVPAYCIPLPTYDQHLCADVIERNGLGMQGTVLSVNFVCEFLDRLDEFRCNIVARRGITVDVDGAETILEKLVRRFLK